MVESVYVCFISTLIYRHIDLSALMVILYPLGVIFVCEPSARAVADCLDYFRVEVLGAECLCGRQWKWATPAKWRSQRRSRSSSSELGSVSHALLRYPPIRRRPAGTSGHRRR